MSVCKSALQANYVYVQFKSDDNPKMSFKFMTYFLLVFMFSSIFGEYTEHDLRKELFKDYNKNIRPVENVSIK